MQTVAVDPAMLSNGTTNVVRMIKDNSMTNGLGNGDDMIIEVVALLFDYIFDNESIPDKAKALIGRLQIPVLKVAILDKSFFSKRHHPARQLLNLLAHATVGLEEEQAEGSALYKELEACIQNVQVEFDTDIAIFETAINDLESFLEQEQVRLDQNIEEAKKVIQGRERLKIAESMAEEEIEGQLEGKPYPEFIKTFAMDKWKNLLIVAYLKEGQDSEAWKSRSQMLDLLIWSTLPKSGLREKKKLVDMLPTLLSGMESGMKLLAMEDAEQNEFLEKLANCHARTVNGLAISSTGLSDSPVDLDMEIKSLIKEEASITSTALDATPGPDRLGSMHVEEINLLGTQGELDRERDNDAPAERLMVKIDPFGEGSGMDENPLITAEQDQTVIEDEYTELVRNLAPGIWFEFHQENGAKTMERLSWISAVLGSYLFTNHEGLKTREISASELEEGLRNGAVVVADDMSFLVDRSFNNLLDELQKKIAG